MKNPKSYLNDTLIPNYSLWTMTIPRLLRSIGDDRSEAFWDPGPPRKLRPGRSLCRRGTPGWNHHSYGP